MPPVEPTGDEEKETGTVSKPVIGIIYPPPEVRNIVDKTASFVARNGPEFETRIRQNEINNPKFNFLNNADPYYAYYQHKVKEFREGRGQEPAAPKQNILGISQHRPVQEQQAKIIQEIIPKEPPPEFEFVADPPSISAFDLDVVKLTAQFVARNGRQFLTNLMNREQRNYQFDFLRPQHSLFNYFTKLVEQYTKILIPPKDLLGKLRKEAEDPKAILDQVKYRVEWAKFQERERRREEEEKERERVAYASIDWHDFVVVETVDFQQHEMGNLPPPTTPEEVGARLLAQERFQHQPNQETVEMEVESDEEMEDSGTVKKTQARDMDIEVQDMEEDSDEEKELEDQRAPPRRLDALPLAPTQPPPPPPPPKESPHPPPLPPTPDQVIVRKDYNPKAPKHIQSAPAPDQFLISPITGERIPADKIQEHMRIGLLDPKWIEQRDRAIASKQDREEVYAAGSAIDSSLKMLAERRTDIFGSGAEEAQIGKKIGEEDRKKTEKVIWDGHTASMEKVTQKARENISIEEQIAVIHKAKGLLPDKEKEKIGPAMPKIPLLHPPLGEPVNTNMQPPPPMPSVSKPHMPPALSDLATTQPKSVANAPKPPPLMQQQPSHPAVPSMLPTRPPMAPRMAPPPMAVGMQPPRMMVMAQPPMAPMRPMMGMPGRPPVPPMMAAGPPHMGGMPPRPGYMQPPVPPQPAPPAEKEDEPPAKKSKTEDQLVPEGVFLQTNHGPVQFNVAVPNVPEKAEWKLSGQTLTFTLPLTDNVSVIKAKVSEALGMPAGKQKLQYEGMFIKDSNTLAFYNFAKNSTVSLQLKERGGRKK